MKYKLLNDKQWNHWNKKRLYILVFSISVLIFLPYYSMSLQIFSFIYEVVGHFVEIHSTNAYCNFTRSSQSAVCNDRVQNTTKNFVVCYYVMIWEKDTPWNLPATQIDLNICTHIIAGFASIDNCSIDLGSNASYYKQIASMKKKRPDLKVIFTVGGTGEIKDKFTYMSETHAKRKIFIRSVLDVIKAYNFDGLDIDWEFPSWETPNTREKIHYVQLLQELRKAFDHSNKELVLSVAVAAPQAIIDQSYNVPQIAEHVDFINLMSYDYHFFTSYYPVTDLNAPLFHNALETGYLSSLNVNFSVNYWISKGMPREKIVVGIPTYGYSYELYNSLNHDLHAPAKGFGKFGMSGHVSYPMMCQFLKMGGTRNFINESRVPYAYKNNEWISYDDVISAVYKAKWIKEQGLKGAMIYSLNFDDWYGNCTANETFPLIRSISQVLSNS